MVGDYEILVIQYIYIYISQVHFLKSILISPQFSDALRFCNWLQLWFRGTGARFSTEVAAAQLVSSADMKDIHHGNVNRLT